MADFWVLISNSTGTVRYCELHSVPSWTSTNMLDKAGTFAFQVPAADPNSAQLAEKRVVTCYTTVGGLQTEVGSGIIDRITLSLDAESNPTGMLNVTGSSRLRELVYRHVGPLLIDNGAGAATLTGPQLIIALAPSGWTLDVIDGANVTTKAVYHQFQDESVLTSFVKLAEITGEHFRASAGKSIAWLNYDLWDASNKSGVRAFYNADPLSIEDNDLGVVISRVSKTSDSYDYFIGRTYAFGVGDGISRVTLNGSVNPGSWSADWVQGSDSKGYYLQHTPTWNTYGIESVIRWKDEATAQTLLETTYEYMRRSQNPVEQYNLDLVGLKTTLEPGTTIRVIAHEYVDTYHSIDIDADLVIMTVNNRMDSDGLRTVSLTCSTIDKYTATEFTVLADQLAQADNYYTHTQPSGSLPGLATSITAGKTLTLAASDNYTVTFPTTGTAALGAGTGTVSSVNSATIANHTHAITSSSNPGAAASLLASNASGYLQLVRLGAGIAPTGDLDAANAVGAILNLRRNDTSVLAGDMLGRLDFLTNDSTVTYNPIGARITANASTNMAVTSANTDLSFWTTDNVSGADLAERLVIRANGNIGINARYSSSLFAIGGAAESFDPASLGAELLTNGDFASSTGWTAVNATLDVSTGKGVVTQNASTAGSLRQSVTTVVNALYKVVFTYYGTLSSAISAGGVSIRFGTSAGGTQLGSYVLPDADIALDKTYTLYFIATTTTSYVQWQFAGTSSVGVIDNASVKNVTGGNVISRGVFSGGGTNGIKIDTLGGVIINDEGDAFGDVRMESDTEVNMFLLDANGNTDGTIYLGGSTNGIQIVKGGDLTLLGTAKYERHIQIDATAAGNPADTPSFDDLFTAAVAVFPTTGSKHLHCQWEIPDDWDGTDAYIEIDTVYMTAASGTDTVKWDCEYRSLAEGEAINNGTSVTVSITDSGDYAQYVTKHQRFTLTFNDANQPLTVQDHVFFKVGRDTAVANDFGGSVGVSAFEIIYQSKGFPTSN